MNASRSIPIAIIDAARQGQEGAADRLVEAAWPHAFRIAYCIVRDRELAADASQEACAVLYGKIGQLRASAAFAVWFYRIVTREASRIERRSVREQTIETDESFDPQAATIDRLDITRALAHLSAQQRAVIVLYYYADLNSREISAILRIPDGTVRFHLLAARRTLRDLLSKAPASPLWEAFDAV